MGAAHAFEKTIESRVSAGQTVRRNFPFFWVDYDGKLTRGPDKGYERFLKRISRT
jgi:hypothetical protein